MDPRIAEAAELFNRREYLACQERLEQVWHDSGVEDRPFIQAVLKLAGALHLLFNRGGGRGTRNLLQQCLLVLDDCRPQRLGVDVQALYDEVAVYLEEFQRADVRSPRFFERFRVPKIKLVKEDGRE
jgi:predicted metal-dependent hydrolase